MSDPTLTALAKEVRRRRTFAIISHPEHTLPVRRGQAATRLTPLRGLREERGTCDMVKSRQGETGRDGGFEYIAKYINPPMCICSRAMYLRGQHGTFGHMAEGERGQGAQGA